MHKKAQGLSVNTIIIAVIALVVLVVLIAVFTGRIGNFTGGLNEANSCEQQCTAVGYEEGTTYGNEVDADNDAEARADGYDKLVGARDGNGDQCYCR